MTAGVDEATYAQALIKFPPHPVNDDAGNNLALGMLDELLSLEDPSSAEKQIAEILLTLIEKYEKRSAIEAPSPLEALRELMAANDLKQKDLVPAIASKGVLSEVLRGKRPISKGIARKLATRFNVSHTLVL